MDSKIKFGIIGCSRIAKRSTIPAIIKSEFAEIEIIGSRSLDKAKTFSNEFNSQKFGTYEDVISDDSVDAVYISTPIGTHEEWAIKAASAGKHILCEKSSTTSFESAKKMIEHSKQNNVRILEGFVFRFHPQHQKVKELIDNNKIGDLVSFNGSFGFPVFPEGDIRYDLKLGGGFLNDSGCYPINASRMIFEEEPIGVSCNLSIDAKTGVDVRGTSYMIYGNKKTASITYGNGNYYQSKYNVWGTEGINLITKITNATIKKQLTDSQSGFRAYSKKALNELNPSELGMGISTEILIKASARNFRISEVPIKIIYDGDTSTHNPVLHGSSVLLSTIKFTSIEHPLKFYGIPSLIFFAIGLFFIYFSAQYYTEFGRLNTNLTLIGAGTTLIAVVLLITGILLFSLVSVVREKN